MGVFWGVAKFFFFLKFLFFLFFFVFFKGGG